MPAPYDFPNRFRVPLCNPTENEKGCLDLELVEQIEHGVSVGFHAACEIRPLRPVHAVGEGLDLEIILDVHQEEPVWPACRFHACYYA